MSSFAAMLVLGLTACGEGPGAPKPPHSPPRPVMSGYVTTAQYDLPVRPVVRCARDMQRDM